MTDPAEGSTQALEDRDATIARLTAERDERQARVEALEAGLRPFAEAWSDNMTADDLSEVDRPAWEGSPDQLKIHHWAAFHEVCVRSHRHNQGQACPE